MVTDIASAKEWIRLRLGAESSYLEHLDSLLDRYARELVSLAYSYGSDGRVFRYGMTERLLSLFDSVISRLKEELETLILDLGCSCTVEDNEDESLRAYLLSLDFGDGELLSDKVEEYCGYFGSMVESLAACSMLCGYDPAKGSREVVASIRKPWDSDLWKTGLIIAGVYDVAATVLRDGGMSFGAGRSNNPYHLIDVLGRGHISSGWMRYWSSVLNPTAEFFRSYIADNTACEACVEEESKGWQPIDDYPYNGYHPNCRCLFVFANKSDL